MPPTLRTVMCLAACLAACAAVGTALSDQEAYSIIRSSVMSDGERSVRESGSLTCSLDGDSTACPLAEMPDDVTTVVYPGGDTRCIFSEDVSGPFGFQVVPGNRSKLLFYFQGGGACWDKISTRLGLCKTSISVPSLIGVLNREDDTNPYKDYTVVQVLYCSGDVHGGNVTRDYSDADGEPVRQTGVQNTLATIDWVLSQSDLQEVQDLVVMGCSAGSLGAQLWSSTLLDKLKPTGYQRASVFPDSFVGVFSENVEGPLIRDFGFCDTELCPSDLKDKCDQGDVLFAEIMDEQLSLAGEQIPFTWLNSKEDIVQISYYVAVAATLYQNTTLFIDPSIYYADVNERFEAYYGAHKNALLYLVQSAQHCYTNTPFLYTADAASKHGGGYDPSLLEWMSHVPLLDEDDSLAGQCDGDAMSLSDKPDHWTKYCDSALSDRVYPPASSV